MKDRRLCIFGEVLFDHFADGTRVLGGAPFNVAWHLQAFGQAPAFISRTGNDADGEAVRAAMHDWGMNTDGMQTDPQLPTGRVNVSFVEDENVYDIVRPSAWDAIEAATLPADCRLLYHGSLCLRETMSQQTLEQLLACKPETVFVDVNLRQPWWRREQVLEMLHTAHWVKLNTDELELLYPAAKGITTGASDFLEEFGLNGMVLTHGAQGAELVTDTGDYFKVRPDRDIEVVDTVGAGDAFAAVIILGLCNDWPLDVTLQRAQLFASRIVGNRGATVSEMDFYQPFINEWSTGA